MRYTLEQQLGVSKQTIRKRMSRAVSRCTESDQQTTSSTSAL